MQSCSGMPRRAMRRLRNSKRSAWKIDFEPSLQRMVIVNQSVPEGAQVLSPNDPANDPAWNCGLITVLPSEGSANNGGRLLIISGITSVGADAAMEHFASPTSLNDLLQRFRREGFPGFPNAYQVIVKCRSKENLLLTYYYARHQVLHPPSARQ